MSATRQALDHPALLHADWPAPAGVRACVTLRRGGGIGDSAPPFDAWNLGARCGDDPACVQRNRAMLVAAAGLPTQPRWLRQVHGTAVLRIDPGSNPERAESTTSSPATIEAEPIADAAVTSQPGVVLAVLTADCLPVLICAADGSEIGAAHAGWRGLAAGVLEATVSMLRTPPRDVLAWLGPAAGPQAYEVGEEVRSAFVASDPAATSAFVATRPGHWYADLYALARRRLAAIGVTRVSGGGLCTISDPERFYSHRRDQRTGRMASLLWRE